MNPINKDGETRDKTINRVLAYFDQNPDEALTIKDAAAKFSAGHCTVRKALQDLAGRGILKARLMPVNEFQRCHVYERAE